MQQKNPTAMACCSCKKLHRAGGLAIESMWLISMRKFGHDFGPPRQLNLQERKTSPCKLGLIIKCFCWRMRGKRHRETLSSTFCHPEALFQPWLWQGGASCLCWKSEYTHPRTSLRVLAGAARHPLHHVWCLLLHEGRAWKADDLQPEQLHFQY